MEICRLKVINSSSAGNGYILKCGNDALILEAGVKINDLLNALNYDVVGVQGVIVSHSHG